MMGVMASDRSDFKDGGQPCGATSRIRRYRPGAPLNRCVNFLWWSHRLAPQDFIERILPAGGPQLIFALHESPIVCVSRSNLSRPMAWSGGIVHGPQTGYYLAGPKPAGAVAGIAFRPGVAGAVLGCNLSELTDQHFSLETFWGRRGNLLHERLLEATSPGEVFRILELNLTAHLTHTTAAHPAIEYALAAPYSILIADVQRRSGYSPKHFIELFRCAVGLTPKYYYRLKRFSTALRSLASGAGCQLADLASDLGYSDQSHLTREFADLAGFTPTRYRPAGSDRPYHHWPGR